MTNGHARMPPHQSHAQHGERSAPKQFGFMLVESRSEIGDPRLHVNAWSSDAEVMLQERDTLRQPAGVQAEFDTLAPAAATGDAPAFSEGDLPVTPVAAACHPSEVEHCEAATDGGDVPTAATSALDDFWGWAHAVPDTAADSPTADAQRPPPLAVDFIPPRQETPGSTAIVDIEDLAGRRARPPPRKRKHGRRSHRARTRQGTNARRLNRTSVHYHRYSVQVELQGVNLC